MTEGMGRFCGAAALAIAIVFAISSPSWAGVPDGFRDLKLGMNKVQVMDILRNSPAHPSFDDRGNEVGEIIRDDAMFRYATYRFDKAGVLVEIDLLIREVVGRDRALALYNSKYGVNVTPKTRTVEANRSVEVKGNDLIIRIEPDHLSLHKVGDERTNH